MSKSELLEAQMHMECINEAWNELWFWETLGLPKPDDNRVLVLRDEIGSRIWAAIYLVQGVATGEKPERYAESIAEANRYNGPNEDDDETEAITH